MSFCLSLLVTRQHPKVVSAEIQPFEDGNICENRVFRIFTPIYQLLLFLTTSKCPKIKMEIFSYILINLWYVIFLGTTCIMLRRPSEYYERIFVYYSTTTIRVLSLKHVANCTGSKLSQCSDLNFSIKLCHRILQYQLYKNFSELYAIDG